MQVENALSASCASVDNQTVATFADPLREGNLASGEQQLPKQAALLGGNLVQRGDVNFGDDENMHRGEWMRVLNGDGLLILIKNGGGQAMGDDLAKRAIFHIQFSCKFLA